jgi:uncharacterized protein (DUF1810 family)
VTDDTAAAPTNATTGAAGSLERFVTAQAGIHDRAVAEIRAGRKDGHWMWFVFPQLSGLGRSEVSRYFAIGSLAEARAYLAHPLLGPRLREAARAALMAPPGLSAEAIFGAIDGLKLRSSMTLFHRVDASEPLFAAVLERFCDGRPDDATDRLLAGS